MTSIVQTQIRAIFDDRQSEFDGLEPLAVGLTLRVDMDFGNQVLHQLFAFDRIHNVVELLKAEQNLVNIVAGDFVCFDGLFLGTSRHKLILGTLDFIVHLVEPFVKVGFAHDVVPVIRVKGVDFIHEFGFDGVILAQLLFGGCDFLFNGSGVYFAVDFRLHQRSKLRVADQLDDDFHYGIVQNFFLNLLGKIAFLSALHLAVLAAIIGKGFISSAILLVLGASTS